MLQEVLGGGLLFLTHCR